MKRKFLIWSAVLTVVFGAALLQSCSADDNTFATEEYGYYTEEEIDAIMALAKKYDLDIEVRFNNYGKKKPLSDFEAKFQALSQLKGKYEMIPMVSNDEEGHSICRKTEIPVCRATTNSLEQGSWSGSKIAAVQKINNDGMYYYDNYDISVSISWDLITNEPGKKRINASAGISELYNVEDKISAGLAGSETIEFSGSVEGEEYDNNNNTIKYKFTIVGGEVNRKTGIGSFFLD